MFVCVGALGRDPVMQVCVTQTNWHAMSSHLAVGPSQHVAGPCALRAASVYRRRAYIRLDGGRLMILRTFVLGYNEAASPHKGRQDPGVVGCVIIGLKKSITVKV